MHSPFVPPNPTVVLTEASVDPTPRSWEYLPQEGRWRVTGVAGSGVSSLIVDTALDRVRAGYDPVGLAVITASKEAASRLRRDYVSRLTADEKAEEYASHASPFRSVHSLAFAVVRQGVDDQVRLITGAEHDAIIRELLAGHAACGAPTWPADIRPAVELVGFARQLRDFLLRAAERGVSAERLVDLGAAFGKGLWQAAGTFQEEFAQIARLAGSHNVNASELVTLALAAIKQHPELARGWHTVLVDDAQHLDPKSAEFIQALAAGAELFVLGGDPEQTVFSFRGADSDFLEKTPVDHELVLGTTRRTPDREVLLSRTPGEERAAVAAFVRRSHLLDDVPWSEIAVVVRSAGALEPTRRALLTAGIPVHTSATDIVLSSQNVVRAVILGLRSLAVPLTNTELEELLVGPIGGADAVMLRRLLRGLRRFDFSTRAIDTLRTLINPAHEDIADVLDPAEVERLHTVLTDRELDILTRMRTVLRAGWVARHENQPVEAVLWELWSATGLSERLAAEALRGGAQGSQADRDLDAMMALFDAAGDFVERHPEATIDTFIADIAAQELPTGVRDRRTARPEAVTVLTAHGTVGQQWQRVVITGVQDDVWPALGETGSIFDQVEFVDYIDRDIEPGLPVSHTAERLAEERRLFHVAATRATENLVITAVDNEDGDEIYRPSRFIAPWCTEHGIEPRQVSVPAGEGDAEQELARRFTGLSRDTVIAELRRVLTDPDASPARSTQAARQLARLAQAGVPGADPEEWMTTTRASISTPLQPDNQPVRLSPSRLEAFSECPLQATLGSVAQDQMDTQPLLRGSLVHAFAEALARGVEPERAHDLVTHAYLEIGEVPAWREEKHREDWERLLARTQVWLETSRAAYTEVGVEVPVSVAVSPEVVLNGRIDRLEKIDDGYVVIDLKTGSTAPSQAKAQDNLQLKAYQFALAHGTLVTPERSEIPGQVHVRTAGQNQETLNPAGGVLVYPAHDTKAVATREQTALSEEDAQHLWQLLPVIASERRGPHVTARVSKACDHCQLKPICPVQPEGRYITDVR